MRQPARPMMRQHTACNLAGPWTLASLGTPGKGLDACVSLLLGSNRGLETKLDGVRQSAATVMHIPSPPDPSLLHDMQIQLSWQCCVSGRARVRAERAHLRAQELAREKEQARAAQGNKGRRDTPSASDRWPPQKTRNHVDSIGPVHECA